MKDIVAIHIKTESGDEYLKVYTDIIDTTDLIYKLKYELNEEFAYISSILINTSLYYGDIDENLIYEAIEKEQN